jgi:hypothetical protein
MGFDRRLRARSGSGARVEGVNPDLAPGRRTRPETEGFEAERRIPFYASLAEAQGWLGKALAELDGHDEADGLPAEVVRLFSADVTMAEVKGGLRKIQAQVSTFASTPPILGRACHANCQGSIVAFVRDGEEMTLGPRFFTFDTDTQARVLVHEAAHFESAVGPGIARMVGSV